MMDGTVRFHGAGGPISHCTASSFAERTVVAAQTCIPVDPALDLVELSLFGCAVMTGVGAVLNTARVREGESVAVVGCGGVGLNVVQGARIAGAGRIVAIDRVQEKLALARDLGATETIDASAVDAVEALAPGVDHVFEAIGRPATIELAVNLTAPGGQAILIGMAPVGATARFAPLDLTLGERAIRGSWYGGVVPDRDFPRPPRPLPRRRVADRHDGAEDRARRHQRRLRCDPLGRRDPLGGRLPVTAPARAVSP